MRALCAANPGDALGNQSQLWRVLIRINAGRYAEAGEQLLAVEQNSIRNADTLTALDALLARSGVAFRTETASASLAIMQRGDSLNWQRDAISRCERALPAQLRCILDLAIVIVHARLHEKDLPLPQMRSCRGWQQPVCSRWPPNLRVLV